MTNKGMVPVYLSLCQGLVIDKIFHSSYQGAEAAASLI